MSSLGLRIVDRAELRTFQWRIQNIQVHLAHQVLFTHHFEYRYVNANDVDKEFYYKQTKKQSFILEFVYTSKILTD